MNRKIIDLTKVPVHNIVWSDHIGKWVTFLNEHTQTLYSGIITFKDNKNYKLNIGHLVNKNSNHLEIIIIYHNPKGPAIKGLEPKSKMNYYAVNGKTTSKEKLFNKKFLKQL